jgi:hypothetical protein|nr:MAG TPA: hypothetical protein [Caudoviricetes sp.]
MKNEKLRKLLASFVDFQIIRDDHMAKKPKECAVMHTISKTKSVYSAYRTVETTEDNIKEQATRLVIAYFQIDFYAPTQARAEEMASELLEVIVFKKRHNLVRNGFGLSDDEIEIKDLTFLEGSQYIYRFSFDVEMNWRETSERIRQLIKDVKVEVENG